jgi:Ca2+-binding RTX toxin-like protein
MPITIRTSLAIAVALATLTSASPTLAAGNVTVSVKKGNLFITGDEADNRIAIDVGDDASSFLISPFDNTTINGEARAFLRVTDVIGDFRIKMQEGNDWVALRYLEETWVVRDSVRIDVGWEVPGSVHIDVGKGDDLVYFVETTVGGDLRVSMGPGDDEIDCDECSIRGNLAVETGTGNDLFKDDEGREVGGSTRIDMGSGNDSLLFDEIVGRTFLGPVHLLMSSGNDRVELSYVTFASSARLEGGTNHDTIEVGLGVNFSVEPRISGFEVIE